METIVAIEYDAAKRIASPPSHTPFDQLQTSSRPNWSKPTLANPTLAILIRPTLARPTLAKPTLAKPTLANVKVLVVCKDFGFSELIVWVF